MSKSAALAKDDQQCRLDDEQTRFRSKTARLSCPEIMFMTSVAGLIVNLHLFPLNLGGEQHLKHSLQRRNELTFYSTRRFALGNR